MEDIKKVLRKFAEERDWDRYHNPKNLVMALSGEIGELTELFQWLNEDESKVENLSIKNLERVKEEVADIFLYLIRLSDKLNIDLIEVAKKKIDINETKYPVELSKNNAIKYNRRDE